MTPIVPQDNRLGPYKVVAHLGDGGMGSVYKAVDTRLGRTVAIKILREGHMDRFAREAQAIAALNHPNICTLYDIGPNYLVMEHIEGTPIRGPMTQETCVRFGLEIAGALQAAHEKGIVHRDLKPANILVTRSGVKLLDFGLAKLEQMLYIDAKCAGSSATTETQDGIVVGTVSYMSPEQAHAKPLDARSDIFSFGLLLYEMVCGRQAFVEETAFALITAIARDEPPPLEASTAFQRLVARCMRKAPADRFQNMGEVIAALEQVNAKPVGIADPQPSIAVLPFANISGDIENEYFGDGLSEEIINALTRIHGLKVIARTSAFAFKGKQMDVRHIAEVLGVANVLEGSVRRAGNRIRITVQLITATDGSHLWSERYDREMTDIFAIQDEISRAIADMLQVKLGWLNSARARRPTDPEAYNLYLQGLHYAQQLTPDSAAKALESFDRAIRLDPHYALPHAALAQLAYGRAMYMGARVRDVMPGALAAANRALDLDPEAAEAWCIRARINQYYEWDWHTACADFGKAIQLNPACADAYLGRAFTYAALDRSEDAITAIRRALELDPISAGLQSAEVLLLGVLRAGPVAIDRARALVRKASGSWVDSYLGALTLSGHGLHLEAIDALQQGLSKNPDNVNLLAYLAWVYGREVNFAEAAPIRARLEDRSETGHVPFHSLAIASEGCGDSDRYYLLLNRALDERELIMPPFLTYLRAESPSDPRFAALLRRVHLDPHSISRTGSYPLQTSAGSF